MKLTTLTSFLVATAAAVPAPQVSVKPDLQAFNLMALRSASPIHFAQTSAARSKLLLRLPKESQGATCNGADSGTATFSLRNGNLFFYKTGSPPQQIFVDRSKYGMYFLSVLKEIIMLIIHVGQGMIGYLFPGQAAPLEAEFEGWNVNQDDILQFKGKNLKACPNSIEGSWSVWFDTGAAQPGGNSACLAFSGKIVPLEKTKAVSCTYSQ